VKILGLDIGASTAGWVFLDVPNEQAGELEKELPKGNLHLSRKALRKVLPFIGIDGVAANANQPRC
jgi:hypothetical protein